MIRKVFESSLGSIRVLPGAGSQNEPAGQAFWASGADGTVASNSRICSQGQLGVNGPRSFRASRCKGDVAWRRNFRVAWIGSQVPLAMLPYDMSAERPLRSNVSRPSITPCLPESLSALSRCHAFTSFDGHGIRLLDAERGVQQAREGEAEHVTHRTW